MNRIKLTKCRRVLGLHPLPGDRVLAAVGDEANYVNRLVWADVSAGREVRREDVGTTLTVAVSADGRRLAVGTMAGEANGYAGYLRVGDPDAPTTDWTNAPATPNAVYSTLTAVGLAFDPAGAVWAGLTRYGRIGDQAVRADQVVGSPTDEYPTVYFDRDHPAGLLAVGRRLAVAAGRYGPSRVEVLDPVEHVRVSAFEPPGAHATALAWSPDGSRLAVLAARRGWLLDSDTGAVTAEVGAHGKQLNAVAFTPDGRRLLTAGNDGLVRAWDVATGGLVTEWDFAVGPVTAVAVACDGLTASAGGSQGRIVVWDLDL